MIFFVITMPEVSNFADDNTLYSSNKELGIVFRNLETDLNNVLAWLDISSLKANPGKFQLMVLETKENDSCILNIGKNKMENSIEVTLLGVKIDKKLKLKVTLKNCAERPLINYILCLELESISQLKKLSFWLILSLIVSLPMPH